MFICILSKMFSRPIISLHFQFVFSKALQGVIYRVTARDIQVTRNKQGSSEGTWLPQYFVKVHQEVGKTSHDKLALLRNLTLFLPFNVLRLPLKQKYKELLLKSFSSPGQCDSVGWSVIPSCRAEFVGSISIQGTCPCCGFDPWLGHVQEVAGQCFSPSFPSPLSKSNEKKKKNKQSNFSNHYIFLVCLMGGPMRSGLYINEIIKI